MNCPRCETATLQERDREGVTVDVCEDCRGLWLDRGELEKLIARERAFEEKHARDSRRPSEGPYKKKKKESWFESLGDLFGG